MRELTSHILQIGLEKIRNLPSKGTVLCFFFCDFLLIVEKLACFVFALPDIIYFVLLVIAFPGLGQKLRDNININD